MPSEIVTQLRYAIIGSIAADSSRFGEAAAILSPEDFGTGCCGEIFDMMLRLHREGRSIDRLLLLARLGEDYAVALEEADKFAVSAQTAIGYCRELVEASQLQRMQDEASMIVFSGNLASAREAAQRLQKAAAEKQEQKIKTALESATEFVDWLYSQEKETFLPWGFPMLDEKLFVQAGNFVCIGGYPSAGKTLFSVQAALHQAKCGYKIGFFSLETDEKTLRARIMSHLSRVPLEKIKRRDLTQPDLDQLLKVSSAFSELPFDIVPAAGMNASQIEAVSLNRGYQVIYIDYLQIVSGEGKGSYDRVTGISIALHTMAQKHGITVCALAQLSRPEKETGKPKPPDMHAFRESGQIEQDADVALLLYTSDPNDYRSDRVLKIGKNKEGERARVDLEFLGAVQTMRQKPETRTEHYNRVQKEIRQAGNAGEQLRMLPGHDPDLPF